MILYRDFGIKEERLVFFGDVLGFKDMIVESETSEGNPMYTAHINNFMSAIKSYLLREKVKTIKIK